MSRRLKEAGRVQPAFRDTSPDGYKTCRQCKEVKCLELFVTRSASSDGYDGRCKDCHAECARAARQADPEKFRVRDQQSKAKNRHVRLIKARARERRRKFGITDEDFETMVELQEGLCAICGEPEPRRRADGSEYPLSVDHCHKTGNIRALLCTRCNAGIGYFLEDVDVMARAIEYINLHNGGPV